MVMSGAARGGGNSGCWWLKQSLRSTHLLLLGQLALCSSLQQRPLGEADRRIGGSSCCGRLCLHLQHRNWTVCVRQSLTEGT
jgi:hypothetical protein